MLQFAFPYIVIWQAMACGWSATQCKQCCSLLEIIYWIFLS